MTLYARVRDSDGVIEREVVGEKEFRGGLPPDLPNRPFTWLPIVIVKPPYNPNTHVREGPIDVVSSTKVTRSWMVRTKTQGELDLDVAADEDITSLVNTLVNAPVLSSTDFPSDLIDRVNARNRINGTPEV